MRRVLAIAAVAATVVASVFVGRAAAVIGGTPDGNAHKGVGYIVFYDKTFTPLWRCTGSLVSTRVLLTAGHCAGTYDSTADGEFHTPVLAQVWFDKDIKNQGNYAGGTCLGVKGWPCSGGDAMGIPKAIESYVGSVEDGTSHDLGVVSLLSAQNKNDVLPLAPLGKLAATTPGSLMTIVGYGLQTYSGPDRQRMQGTVKFLRVEDGTVEDDELYFADFTNDAPGAAACNGDSGGPVLNAQGQIVAVMSLVDGSDDGGCLGGAYHYRTDTNEAKQFLARYGVQLSGSGRDQTDWHPGWRKHGHGLFRFLRGWAF
jgi:V8-like Glu-specific endopeptidase